MKLEICAIYCICDDYLNELNTIAWHNKKMKDSEVMTSLIVATQFFWRQYYSSRKLPVGTWLYARYA